MLEDLITIADIGPDVNKIQMCIAFSSAKTYTFFIENLKLESVFSLVHTDSKRFIQFWSMDMEVYVMEHWILSSLFKPEL